MARGGIKSYRRFLQDLETDLSRAITDAEDAGWHHMDPGSAVGQHYLRCITWYQEVQARGAYYDIKRTRGGLQAVRKLAEATEALRILERYDSEHHHQLGDADRSRLDGGDNGAGAGEGDDPRKDDT